MSIFASTTLLASGQNKAFSALWKPSSFWIITKSSSVSLRRHRAGRTEDYRRFKMHAIAWWLVLFTKVFPLQIFP